MPTVDGALWRERMQIGKEVTPGTPVAATRVAYANNVSLNRTRASREHRFSTGTRDNVRARTQGPVTAGGSIAMPVSADELLEWCLAGFDGTVTPTTPVGATNTRDWAFAPGLTPASITVERLDGANPQQGQGVRVNQYTIAGSVREANTATMELFGTDVDMETFTTLTTGLTERTPTFLEGWQTALYVDPLGSTPGTTAKIAMISWNVVVNNGMGRKYLAQKSLAARRVTMGQLGITANLLLEGAEADTVSELTRANNNQPVIVRLEFEDADNPIETGFNPTVWIDLPGYWTSPDLNQTDEGTRAYGFPLNYIYDPTLGAGVKVTLRNARTAAF